jgi:hypothetical protein
VNPLAPFGSSPEIPLVGRQAGTPMLGPLSDGLSEIHQFKVEGKNYSLMQTMVEKTLKKFRATLMALRLYSAGRGRILLTDQVGEFSHTKSWVESWPSANDRYWRAKRTFANYRRRPRTRLIRSR